LEEIILKQSKSIVKQGLIPVLPFYLHKDIFEHLTTFVLFKSNSESLLMELFKKNPHVALTSNEELLDFFQFFIAKVNADTRFKKLFIEENHKAEILKLSAYIQEANLKLDQIIAAVDPSHQLRMDLLLT
jgi:hypothetical protein